MLERHQMGAMVLHQPGQALRYEERACPPPGLGQIRVRVEACAVCRTDLHVVDGELPNQKLPIVPGHEVVGIVEMVGEGVADIAVGTRVGIAWLAHTCGDCSYCRSGRENLCDFAAFTGYTRDGGFASHVIAEGAYVFPLPKDADATKLAPLMCAGMIGWRCLRALGAAQEVGLYGFGAAAHLVAQVLRWEGRAFHAFTRPGDEQGQALARSLGAAWAGGSDTVPPMSLDGAIVFAPVGSLVPTALSAIRKGGRVVCGGIHMTDIPPMPYRLLWGERELVSVANLTRRDGQEFLRLASRISMHPKSTIYALCEANRALDDLRQGRIDGVAVLVP
ncbi:alcohol dehydrogenase OS=Castellaniella defragrans OX=75697 GN=HNR28_002801 PE=3 SV=1 [Castellaniella defragrans]